MPVKRGKKIGPKQKAKELALEKRRELVAELKLKGYSYREIAQKIGASSASVCRDIDVVMRRSVEKANDYIERERQITLGRLERALKVLQPRLSEESEDLLDAIDRLVKLEASRGKFIGFDKPFSETSHGTGGGNSNPNETRIVSEEWLKAALSDLGYTVTKAAPNATQESSDEAEDRGEEPGTE